MKIFLTLITLIVLCFSAQAVNTPFSSPPFSSTDFIVDQPGNSIRLRNPGGGGTNGAVYNFDANDFIVTSGTNVFLSLNVPRTNRPNTFYNSMAINSRLSVGQTGIWTFYEDGHGEGVYLVLSGMISSDNTQFTTDGSGNVSAVSYAGAGPLLTGLDANHIAINTVPTARLGSGVADNTTYLRGDQTWQPVSGGSGSGITTLIGTNAFVPSVGGVSNSVGFIPTNYAAQLTSDQQSVFNNAATNVVATNVPNPVLANHVLFIPTNYQSVLSAAQLALINNAVTNAYFTNSGTGPFVVASQLAIPTNNFGGGGGASSSKFYNTALAAGILTTNSTSVGVGTNLFPSASIGGISRPGFISMTNINGGNNGGYSFGDINGDGYPDMAGGAATIFQAFTNNKTGLFYPLASSISSAFTTAGRSIMVDVNGDGKMDVVTLDTGASNFQVFTNNGTGIFTKLGSSYSFSSIGSIFSGNLFCRGYQDLLVSPIAGGGASTVLYTNDGSGIFSAATNFSTAYQASSFQGISVSDMNGDGKADIIFANGNDGVSVLTNNGSGVFAPYSSTPTGNAYAITSFDANRDGMNDYAYHEAGASLGGIVVYTNNGSGFGFWSSNSLVFNDSSAEMSSADYNSDGRQDLVFLSQSGTSSIILTNSGSQLIPALTNAASAGGTRRSISSLDFNQDGYPDVGMGTTTFSSAAAGGTIYLNGPVFSGIFQGDGSALTNGNITVTTSSASATTFTAGAANFGTLDVKTNYQTVSAAGSVIYAGNGGTLTNIWHVTTSAATSGTVTADTTHQIETTYLSSGSTIVSITWALPTSVNAGKTFFLHPKSAITTLTITGGSFIDTAVTTMIAGQTIGFQTVDASGTYLRIQ